MEFSVQWDTTYRDGKQLSVWPFSELVSYVYRYTDIPKKSDAKVLEIGFGAGANIGFFEHLGVDYYGIEGSGFIVEQVKNRFPHYADHLVAGDFAEDIPFKEEFDLVVDRSAATNNSTIGIQKTIQNIIPRMKSNAMYIGIDWFSTKHDEFMLGDPVDEFTRMMKENCGQFTNVGRVHFSDKDHILELFKSFDIKVLEEKVITTEIPRKHQFASWNFVACKK